MKRFNHRIKWTLAAILIAGITAAPVMAEKTTPATGKNSAVPAVPRAIPDLLPYHKFDPPKSKLFDMSKLTISGDLRVRPEFRNNTPLGQERTTRFRAAMGAVGLQLLHLAGRDLLLPAPTFQELGGWSQLVGPTPMGQWKWDPLCPAGLHAGAELPGAEPDHQSRAATGGLGQPSHVRAFRLEQRGMGPRRLDRELQAQQEHHPASGLVADG